MQYSPENLIKSSPVIGARLHHTPGHWPCCFQATCSRQSQGSIDHFDSCLLPITDQRWPVALPKVMAVFHPRLVSCPGFSHFKSNQKLLSVLFAGSLKRSRTQSGFSYFLLLFVNRMLHPTECRTKCFILIRN